MSSFPNEWLCPITLSIMRNPVIASDGHSYEKSAIEEWFTRSNHSPKTNQILRSLDLILNHALRNTIEDFFKNNPLALHSSATTAAANAYGYYGGAIPIVTSPPVSMASWHYQSGGCFNGDCKVLMANGYRKMIKDVEAGEFVKTPTGDKKVHALVVCGSHLSSQPMVQLGDLSITPWHPIFTEKNGWVFPANLAPYTSRPIKTVYNFVLAGGHIVDVEGYQCCTLGHGFKGPIIEHEFFGTEKVVNDLQKIKGWETGRPTFINLIAVRDLNTGMITAWLDEPF